MDCEQALALMSSQIDREIQPHEQALLQEHLRDCAACRAAAEAFALQHRELRRSFEPRRAAVSATVDRVATEVTGGRRAAPKKRAGKLRRPLPLPWIIVGGCAAAFLLAALVAYWNAQRPQPATPLPPFANTPTRPPVAHEEKLTPRPLPPAPGPMVLRKGESIATGPGERRRALLADELSVLLVDQNTSIHVDDEREVTLDNGAAFFEAASLYSPTAALRVKTKDRLVTALDTKFAVQVEPQGTRVLVAEGKVSTTLGEPTPPGAVTYVSAGSVLAPGSARVTPCERVSHALDWTRDLMAANDPRLVPASEHDGGSLIAVDANGQEAKLSLRRYHVDVHIEDGFARTTIDQTYFNHHPWRLEGTFHFPLPPDASLSRLAMYVDGNLMEGGMVERDYGRTVYERVVNSQRDPALLEWVDGSTFKMRVFPLEGRQEKRLLLSYSQRLPSLYGRAQYRFPAGHSLQTVRDWSFHARVRNGAGVLATSPTHPGMRHAKQGPDLVLDDVAEDCKVDRDVVLYLIDPDFARQDVDVARFSRADHEGVTYLMLRDRPYLPGQTERTRRDWIFLYESSADRDPLLARAQVEIVRGMLNNAERDDTFRVLAAGTLLHPFNANALPVTPENVAAAIRFLENRHLVGALDLGRAFLAAEEAAGQSSNSYVVHVGGGLTAMGQQQDTLAKLLSPRTRYVGVGVGKRWSRALMKECAEKTGGYLTQINPDESIRWRTFDLMATLNTPRLLDVKVVANPRADAPKDEPPPLFLCDNTAVAQGEEICAVTRLATREGVVSLRPLDMPESLTIIGSLDGQPYRREVRVENVAAKADYLPRTWTKLEIDRLLAEHNQDHRATIIDLSKSMYVMTPYTSLLVLESEAMYQEFKVDRGRKDHWAMYDCPNKIPVVYEPDPTMPTDERNAPKGTKPTANQMLQTITVRTVPHWLERPDQHNRKEHKNVNGLEYYGLAMGRVTSLYRENELGRRIEHWSEHGSAPWESEAELLSDFVSRPRPFLDGDEQAVPVAEKKSRRTLERLTQLVAEQQRVRAQTELGITREIQPTLGYINPSQWLQNETDKAFDLKPELTSFFINGTFAPNFRSGDKGKRGLPIVEGFATPTTVNSFLPPVRLDPNELRHDAQRDSATPSLMYQRLQYSEDPRLFTDLLAYAPGLNTSEADIQTVLEAEALPELRHAPGRIAPEARRLIDQARNTSWHSLTLSSDKEQPELTVLFDGSGRFAYERALPLGLEERVVCDGTRLLHLYPEIGVAAKRAVSRFHRAEMAALLPWVVPPAEDLARGADLECTDGHTVALVPHWISASRNPKQDMPAHVRLNLIFGDDRLTERRLVEMPSKKTVLRELYDGAGGVRLLDAGGKELNKLRRDVRPAKEPELRPDTSKLVVLPLPFRSRQHVMTALGLNSQLPLGAEENGCHVYLEADEAATLLAALVGQRNASEASVLYREYFQSKNDERPGLFTLLAACGASVSAEPGFQTQLAKRPEQPLLRYFAMTGNGVYAFAQRRLPIHFGDRVGQGGSFLHELAVCQDLLLRWPARGRGSVRWEKRQEDAARSFAFIRRHRGDAMGWAVLHQMQDKTQGQWNVGEYRRCLAFAEVWGALADGEEAAYRARYEQACCLNDGQKHAAAVAQFKELYTQNIKAGRLPPLDRRFSQILESADPSKDEWNPLIRQTAATLVAEKRRGAALALARQCRQLGKEPLAETVAEIALDRAGADAEGRSATLDAIAFYREFGQPSRGARLLDGLLAQDSPTPELWRLASRLSEENGQTEQSVRYLEKALDVEYQHLPEIIDLQRWRADYGKLLAHYQASVPKVEPGAPIPPGMVPAPAVARPVPPPGQPFSPLAHQVIKVVDRWRAHDPEAREACFTAGVILRAEGMPELAWEYFTTARLERGNTAAAWTSLASEIERDDFAALADRALVVAAEAEPKNADVLWQRWQKWRDQNPPLARQLLLRLAEEEWPERYAGVCSQARWQLRHR